MDLAAKAPHSDNVTSAASIGKPVIFSVVLHILVFLFATIGIPFMAKDVEIPQEIPISVDFLDDSTLSPTETPVKEEPKEDLKELPTPPEKPKPIYNSSDSVPELTTPSQPEPVAEEVVPEIDPTEIKTPPKPKVKPKINKPKPKPIAQEKPKDTPKKDEQDFTSLLKSLTPDEPEQTNTSDDAQDLNQPRATPDYAKQLNMSELAALNSGVSPCWRVNAGGRDAAELIVELRVTVNPDMRVGSVTIIDQAKYNSNPHFRAAADNARRALLNEQCRTLNLPVEKYQFWKSFTYVFDPSEMI